MIEIGKYNNLEILRLTSVGLYLGDEEGEDVLLPNKYVPDEYEIGDMIEVFVYLDYDERKVATDIIPKIHLHEFELLEVTAVSEVGAFLDWGLEKNLLVPFREQKQNMEEGRWYIVYLNIDEQTNRLYASNKLDKFLQNTMISVEEGEEVEILIRRKTELGYSVIINDAHKGLIFHNEIFKELRIGDKMNGYVKEIREDNKIDISLSPIGYENFNDENMDLVFEKLNENDGFLPLNDKSAPAAIYNEFGISKKAFKKSVGALYRLRKIMIDTDGIRLV